MGAPLQQVEATPCSNRQEGVETFMVGSTLYIVRRGVPLTRASDVRLTGTNRHP
jgi:hypothetical protein